MSNITIDELLPMIGKINIIDIRNGQSYNNQHIDGAINIPFEKLIVSPSKYLDINKKYFIYCRSGVTSKKACQILSNYGFKVINIIGGYEEWVLKK